MSGRCACGAMSATQCARLSIEECQKNMAESVRVGKSLERNRQDYQRIKDMEGQRDRNERLRGRLSEIPVAQPAAIAKFGIEPCVACRHSSVPAHAEPCVSCISHNVTNDVPVYANWQATLTMDDPLGQRAFAVETPVDPVPVQFIAPTGYAALADVLTRALEQASAGKGAQRHAQGQAFEQQPMQQLIRLYGVGFALGQAAKKAQEAQRLPTVDRQVAELLGAINYLAGAVIAIESGRV